MPGSVKKRKCWISENVEIWKICFKDAYIIVLVFVEAFLHKKEMERSRFGGNVGSSRNHPNSIGIHQESLINNLGIIKTQNTMKNKKRRKPKKTLNLFALLNLYPAKG